MNNLYLRELLTIVKNQLRMDNRKLLHLKYLCERMGQNKQVITDITNKK